VLIIIEMLSAVITTHLNNGFFMNWTGTQKGEGYEFHLLIIGLVLAILINGSGKFSIDQKIAN
jgi:putative oxidoreductase